MTIRSVILLTGLLLVAACETNSIVPTQREAAQAEALAIYNAPAQFEALPPQTLSDGACGIFLFHVREPHTFTLFENEAERTVKILHERQIIETGVTEQTASFVEGDQFRRVYFSNDEQLSFTLTGTVGPETVTGQMLNQVVLRTRQLDGTEIVQPLGGARTCRGNMPVWSQ